MSLTTSRYAAMLSIQYALLIIDLLINCFSDFFRKSSVIVLLFYIIQDVCLIFALILLVLSFFSTYAFQAGLVDLLYNRFRMTFVVTTFYLLISISLHCWTLSARWSKPLQHVWPSGLIWLFVIHKLFAVFYYYYYKCSVLRISDPRLYDDFNWQRHQGT